MGIGEALLKATLEKYQQQGVVEASLEAFTVNKKPFTFMRNMDMKL